MFKTITAALLLAATFTAQAADACLDPATPKETGSGVYVQDVRVPDTARMAASVMGGLIGRAIYGALAEPKDNGMQRCTLKKDVMGATLENGCVPLCRTAPAPVAAAEQPAASTAQ